MKLKNIDKVYHNSTNNVTVFSNLSYDFTDVGLTLILGESGAGKTTLFNIISGRDNDYTGSVECESKIEYLNQKIELFENLSVKENLQLVCSDLNEINLWVNRFFIQDLADQLVKRLSNGEKRRVQTIRSLLIHPDMLLCDEPTASLDEENAELLCKALKEASKYVPILVTTHDEELFSKYSDTVLRIIKENLIEEKREKVEKANKIRQDNLILKNNEKRYVQATKLYLKAHGLLSVMTIFFLLCIILSSYSIFYYSYTRGQTYQKEQWYYNNNLIELTSENQLYYPDYQRTFNLSWDNFTGAEIKDVIEEEQGIVAVSYLRDYYYFQDFDDKDKMDKFYFSSKQELLTQSTPFFTIEEINDTNTRMEDEDARVFSFEIFKESAFPLQCGTYPTLKNEVLINEDYANLLLSYLDVQAPEDLIGKTIHIDVDPLQSAGELIMYHSTNVPRLPIKIVGITSFENKFEHRIYFQKDQWMKQLAELYDQNVDELSYNSIRFLTEPSSNMQDIIEDLNNKLPTNYSKFTHFTLSKDLIEKYGQIAQLHVESVLIIGTLLIISAYFVICYLTFFFKSQYKKETGILKNYGYSVFKINLFVNMVLCISTLFIAYVLSPILINTVNEIAMQFIYRPLLMFDSFVLNISIVITFISYLIVMQTMSFIILRRKRK